jgi:hypothetical protein
MRIGLCCSIAAAAAASTVALLGVVPACSQSDDLPARGDEVSDAGPAGPEPAGESGPCATLDAASLDPASVARGRSLVVKLECQKCHGQTLTGNRDGVMSPTTVGGRAYPPNLTSDPVTGLGCWTDQQIETALLYGIDNQGAPLCPPMPLFVEAGVDPSGAVAIVSFLRSLPPVTSNIPNTPDCTGTTDDGGPDVASDDATSDDSSSDGGQETEP